MTEIDQNLQILKTSEKFKLNIKKIISKHTLGKLLKHLKIKRNSKLHKYSKYIQWKEQGNVQLLHIPVSLSLSCSNNPQEAGKKENRNKKTQNKQKTKDKWQTQSLTFQ